MALTFHLDIVSNEAQIFSGLVEMINVTGKAGQLGILYGHTPLISLLEPGFVRMIKEGGEEEVFYISGGILEVQPKISTILANTVVRADHLDEAAALEAKKQAEKMLAEKTTEFKYTQAMSELMEAAGQLKAIKKLRDKIK